jgi:phosphoribosyl-AMP cyclohydrolase
MKPNEGELTLDPEGLKWDGAGLIPAVVQDAAGEVLMVAYMNREALAETLETGFGTYYTRSRQKLWRKGEDSGHRQKVLELRFDCDLDCILLRVEQVGGACHTGQYSCFYRKVEDGKLVVTSEPVFDAEAVYNKG